MIRNHTRISKPPMPGPGSPRRLMAVIATVAAMILSAVLMTGCPFGVNVPGEKQAPIEADVSEIVPGSLLVDVTSYHWELWSSKSHIRVYGEVVNNTGKPVQGLTLSGTLYDSKGNPVTHGESYIVPSYLPAGGVGTFEFVGLFKRSSNMGATRLVTISRALSAY